MPSGETSKYDPKFVERAREMCLAGAIQSELAAEFNVTKRTITRWINTYKEFKDAVKEATAEADKRVEQTLWRRATGYTFGGKYYPPDTTAMIFWLKNRQPDQWRDKHELKHDGDVTIEVVKYG